MDVEEAMRERFRQHLPKFVQNINPIELLSYLPCLGDQNSDEVTNCQTMRSRREAVWKLHGHLIRKKNGCRQLVAALRDNSIDQSELADLLDPPQSAEPRSLEPLPEHLGRSPKAKPERLCNPDENAYLGPFDGSTLLRDLPACVIFVYRMLDHGLNNWMTFAAKLNMYKSSEVDDLEKQESPGRAVVNDWIQKQNPTLEMLVRKLDEVERKDMMYELEKITKYKCPGLNSSIPVVEDSLPTQQGGDEKPPVDEQTALKMGPDKFYPDSNDTYQDWEQTPNEGLDISIKLKKESDKTFEPTGYDTGYNTSASSSESDRNDSSLESKISDSSLEVDGPITMNRDDTNYPGMKMRYTPTTSGKLAMTVVSSKDEIPLDKEGTSFMDRNQRIIRQESMESYRGPVQTEPSMNSNQFINLKQERHVQDVRPKTCSPKVTMTPVAQEADQVPSSQQQVVPLENYVKLHTEEAPTLQDISSFGDTMDDFRDEMMSSHPRISDVEFNSARPETETSISTEYGFFPLDLSSMTSENSDVASNACHNNVEEHCLELAVSQDSLNYANGSPLKEYPCCGGDLEVANISSKNHSAGFDLRVEELTASWTDSSVPSTGNNDSLTELKRRQNRYPQANLRSIGSIGNDSRIAELPNGVCDLTETNRGNDNPQSGSLSSLTSLGIGLAAGVLMVAAYNKFK